VPKCRFLYDSILSVTDLLCYLQQSYLHVSAVVPADDDLRRQGLESGLLRDDGGG